MGELTWLLILGSIALIFPFLIISVNDYLETDYEFPDEYNYLFSLSVMDEEYLIIQNLTCDNWNDNNNYELLRNNMFNYFLPENAYWIWKPLISVSCFINPNHVEEKIDDYLLNETQLNEYIEEEITKEEKNLISRMNLTSFFNSITQLPNTLQFIIFSFYGLFIGYIIWRTFTIG